jgi:hypothetical protein
MVLGILAIVLAGLAVLVDLGAPTRQRTQIDSRKFTALSIISPFSYLFLSMWLSICAVFTAGYFALLISFLNFLHMETNAFAATTVALFAGLTAIMMIVTFAVLVGLIVTANLRVLMTIVKSFLPDKQIPRKVNLVSLAMCAGFVATPIACLIMPLNFATGYAAGRKKKLC